MDATPSRDPKYRHYKPKNLAVVRIDGLDHYLGKFNSSESWEKYHRLLAERHKAPASNSAPAPTAQDAPLTVTKLAIAYYEFAERYYVKDGKPTSQVRLIRLSLKVLRRLFGATLAKDFDGPALETCQAEFIRNELCRNECNRRTKIIRSAFKWAVSKSMIDEKVLRTLQTVAPLKQGRTEARETEKILPVPAAVVERTIQELTPTVRAMVWVQLLSAMRPGEIAVMKAQDLDMSGDIWEYAPEVHKGQHRSARCLIMIGTRAQEIIRSFMTLDISGYLFTPERAIEEHAAHRREQRKTPLYGSHVKHQAKKQSARDRRALNERYTVNAYRLAITRACDRAFPHPESPRQSEGESRNDFSKRYKAWCQENKESVRCWRKAHRWHPHQLRHSAATLINKRFGVESSRVVLGHTQLSTATLYAEKDLELARQIMREIG